MPDQQTQSPDPSKQYQRDISTDSYVVERHFQEWSPAASGSRPLAAYNACPVGELREADTLPSVTGVLRPPDLWLLGKLRVTLYYVTPTSTATNLTLRTQIYVVGVGAVVGGTALYNVLDATVVPSTGGDTLTVVTYTTAEASFPDQCIVHWDVIRDTADTYAGNAYLIGLHFEYLPTNPQ